MEKFKVDGRLNRLNFIKSILITILVWPLICGIICMLFVFIGRFVGLSEKSIEFGFVLPLVLGTLANIIKDFFRSIIMRLHDINKSGLFSIIVLVPVIGQIFLIYLFCAPGQVGANQYGADPLEN